MRRPIFLRDGKVDGTLVQLGPLEVVEPEEGRVEVAEVLRRDCTTKRGPGDTGKGRGSGGRARDSLEISVRTRDEDRSGKRGAHLLSHARTDCTSTARRQRPRYTKG